MWLQQPTQYAHIYQYIGELLSLSWMSFTYPDNRAIVIIAQACLKAEEDAAALIKIHPIPLQPTLVRETSLHTDLVIIAHFPSKKGHQAKCVELALGRKCNGVRVPQGKL